MVHPALTSPGAALWIYVFVVIILLVLSIIGAGVLSRWDTGNIKIRGGLGFLLIAILLGIVVYFLVAAGIEQWSWFIALLPTAFLLFTIYFAFFAVFGRVAFWIASLIALFVMIWLIYFSIVEQQWSLLAFPVVYLILIILGGFGMSAWSKWQKNNPDMGIDEILAGPRKE